jgi:hypothetical protein
LPRDFQPKRSAPVRRHSTSRRSENGRCGFSGSTCVSLMMRNSTGSRPSERLADDLQLIDRIGRGGVIESHGLSHDRVEGPRKTTGTAPYAYEWHNAVPNQAYGYVVGSSIAKGRIFSIRVAEARRAPGVIAIVTADTVGKLGKGKWNNARVLGGPEIQHYHQAVALVVAEKFEQARAAAQLVRVRRCMRLHHRVRLVGRGVHRGELYGRRCKCARKIADRRLDPSASRACEDNSAIGRQIDGRRAYARHRSSRSGTTLQRFPRLEFVKSVQ